MMPVLDSEQAEPHSRATPRRAWVMALAAMAALVLIAAMAVAGFVGLDLLRGPQPGTGSGDQDAPIVAPAPTTIRPELHALPGEWDDDVG